LNLRPLPPESRLPNEKPERFHAVDPAHLSFVSELCPQRGAACGVILRENNGKLKPSLPLYVGGASCARMDAATAASLTSHRAI
jgi:hypothetical protein